jgi:hypothetical protein
MTQVGDHRNDFDARLVGSDLEVGGHRQVQRDGRAVATAAQREPVHHRIRQHGDLAARQVDRRQPLASDLVQRRPRRDAQRRRRDVDADLPAESGQRLHREGIVNFGRRRVVDRESAHVGSSQTSRRQRRCRGRKSGAMREVVDQEALQVIIVRRAESAAFLQQLRRRQAGFAARRFQRLGLAAVAVGLVEQLHDDRCENSGGSVPAFSSPTMRTMLKCQLALLFEAGQSSLENVGGCPRKRPLPLR